MPNISTWTLSFLLLQAVAATPSAVAQAHENAAAQRGRKPAAPSHVATPKEKASPAYQASMAAWHQERVRYLLSEKGWVNLAGLLWLEEGSQSFGSGADQQLVFPAGRIADKAGQFIRRGDSVWLVALPGSAWQDYSESPVPMHQAAPKTLPVNQPILVFAPKFPAPYLGHGSLRFNIIKRADKLGIRLRDLNHPDLASFPGIERFPTDSNWRVNAVFLPPPPDAKINVRNVLGQNNATPLAGRVRFNLMGRDHTLDAIDDGADFLLVMGDRTTGKETYGGGRFLSIPKTSAKGLFVLDFNQAYNPPCVYTPYATCPLPPPQNILPIAVTVGEKLGKH